MTATHKATCHCGKVAAMVTAKFDSAIECNCSICRRKGSILAFVAPPQFTLETPRDALTVYTFNTHNIRHQFCKTCGCAPFGEGTGPDGKPMVGLNLRCVDGLDLSAVNITQFDGASLPLADGRANA